MGDYTVYKHINKVNGKVYVGITKQKPEDRWKNGNGYNGLYFERAIKKYGWDGFEHIIVCENLSKTDACTMEQLLIKALRTTDPKYGYNQTVGGDGGGMAGKHHTTATKNKISKSMQKCFFSEAHRKNISLSKKGTNHPQSKAVLQYTKNGEFVKKWAYMNEAAQSLGLSKGNISNACLGRTKSCGGFIWVYEKKEE